MATLQSRSLVFTGKCAMFIMLANIPNILFVFCNRILACVLNFRSLLKWIPRYFIEFLKGIFTPSRESFSDLLSGTINLGHFPEGFLIQIGSDLAAILPRGNAALFNASIGDVLCEYIR